jgi:hypothetical protein
MVKTGKHYHIWTETANFALKKLPLPKKIAFLVIFWQFLAIFGPNVAIFWAFLTQYT